MLKKRLKILALTIAAFGALLLFFEWLGSEQQQHMVETPLALPEAGAVGGPQKD